MLENVDSMVTPKEFPDGEDIAQIRTSKIFNRSGWFTQVVVVILVEPNWTDISLLFK